MSMDLLKRSWEVEDELRGLAAILDCNWREVPQAVRKLVSDIARLNEERDRVLDMIATIEKRRDLAQSLDGPDGRPVN